MGIMIFMLKSQRRAFRCSNNLRARLYIHIASYKNWLKTSVRKLIYP